MVRARNSACIDEIVVGEKGIENGGKHLKPAALHKMLDEKKQAGEEVIFYDGRNMYEAQIGKFKNTIIPKTVTSRDFKKDLEEMKEKKLQRKNDYLRQESYPRPRTHNDSWVAR